MSVNPSVAAVAIVNPVRLGFAAAASSGAGAGVADALPAVAAPPVVAEAAREATLAPAAAPAIDGQALPRTGAAVAGLVVSGLTALLLGFALRRFGRRSVQA